MMEYPGNPGNQTEDPGKTTPVDIQPQLVLPAPPDTEQPVLSGKHPVPTYSGKYPARIRPEQLIRPTSAPPPKGGPVVKLGYFWRKDPAYKAFIIAIAFVMIAAIFFVSLAAIALQGNSGSPGNNSLSQNPSGGPSPTSTVDLQPAFPTPGGANGSTASSQPPPQKTPVLQQTPSPAPDPNPGPGGPLTVQITNLPSRVFNNSRLNVSVSTGEGGVSVRLVVRYSTFPFAYQSSTRVTGPQGNVNLSWLVNVFGGGRNVTATVVAVATDQNGHTARSTPMTVQIIRGG
ncbi:MAG TPA: hypothetical protein VJ761_18790 [Ktedonobacteraceae bacterium]|nr:hypothetical protein [Ktedonobacteraceae bacterium]